MPVPRRCRHRRQLRDFATLDQMLHAKKDLIRHHFDRSAAGYDSSRISRWQRYFQQKVLDHIHLEDPISVLDVGCGTGWFAVQLHTRLPNSTICGIDISAQMIHLARQKSSSLPNVHFKVGDAQKIDYPSETFDYITCIHSFRHYSDPSAALREFYRVLKREGTLLLLEHYRDMRLPLRLTSSLMNTLLNRYNPYYPSTSDILTQLRLAGFQESRTVLKIEKLFFLRKLITAEFLIRCSVPPNK
jgi:ubiquinone/menaquinone biosynthesis C-methylase UbiE